MSKWFMTTFVVVVIVIVSSFMMTPVIAQGDNSSLPTETEILEIINIGDKSEDEINKVESWLNSDRADDFPALRNMSNDYLDEIQSDRERVKEGLSGSKRVSSDVTIIGYDFDRNNETVTFALELDKTKNLVIQDIGKMSKEGSFTWRSEQFGAGYHRIQMEAIETNIASVYTQRVAVADTEANRGVTIDSIEDRDLFNEVKPWMIPLAGLSGAFTVVLLIVRKVRKMERDGVNELIPLE